MVWQAICGNMKVPSSLNMVNGEGFVNGKTAFLAASRAA
jgi:hypothetical protein